jgi:hypothetical protein
MAAVDTGKSFANGEQLTAAKLNQMFGNSTFAAGAVDNSTMTVNSLGQLAVNQVTSSNVATNGLNLDDIQQIDTDRVLGRLSAGSGNIEQITVDEDLSSVSTNHDQLATSKAIKDYIDSQITAFVPKYINITSNSTLGIAQTNNGTDTAYTYPIADFAGGAGLDTSKIRGFFVEVLAKAQYNGTNTIADLRVVMPDGNDMVLLGLSALSPEDNNQQVRGTLFAPVNTGQTNFVLEADFSGSGNRQVQFTIRGCYQHG